MFRHEGPKVVQYESIEKMEMEIGYKWVRIIERYLSIQIWVMGAMWEAITLYGGKISKKM